MLDTETLRHLGPIEFNRQTNKQISLAYPGQVIIAPEVHNLAHIIKIRDYLLNVYPSTYSFFQKPAERLFSAFQSFIQSDSTIPEEQISKYNQVFFEGFNENDNFLALEDWKQAMDNSLLKDLGILLFTQDLRTSLQKTISPFINFCNGSKKNDTTHNTKNEYCHHLAKKKLKAILSPKHSEAISATQHAINVIAITLIQTLNDANEIEKIEFNRHSKNILDTVENTWRATKNIARSMTTNESKIHAFFDLFIKPEEEFRGFQSVINAIIISKISEILAKNLSLEGEEMISIFSDYQSSIISGTETEKNDLHDLLVNKRSIHMAHRVADMRCKQPDTTIIAIMGEAHVDVFRKTLEESLALRKADCEALKPRL